MSTWAADMEARVRMSAGRLISGFMMDMQNNTACGEGGSRELPSSRGRR
jgi:hypothetical protein